MGVLLCTSLAGFTPMATAVGEPDPTPIYLDSSGTYTFEERAADRVSRMTYDEKVWQVNAQGSRPAGMAIPRLGVASYRYWNEALHGVANSGATSFPSALGIAATWNRDLVNEMASAISDEARAYNISSNRDLTYWSPTINIARDPRWGRADESYGEDPYLVGEIGSQFVGGMQNGDPLYTKVVSTPKHFFANNAENYRRNGDSVLTERELREYYTPAFGELLGENGAGAHSTMTAYNEVNGVPVSASTEYVQDLARRTWGFDGFITTDCDAIRDIWDRHVWTPDGWDHPVNKTEASAYGIKAGADLDCSSWSYRDTLPDARDQGLVTEDDLDVVLVRVFAERMRLGEFDPAADVQWRSNEYTTANQLHSAAHVATADQMSNEAPVLLKNEAPIGGSTPALPLQPEDADNIVLLGYLGREYNLGGYSGNPSPAPRTPQVALNAAIQAYAPGASVTQIDGITPRYGQKPGVLGVTFLDDVNAVTFTSDPPPRVRNDTWDWLGWRGIQYDPVSSNPTPMMPNADWGGVFSVSTTLPDGTTQVAVRQQGNGTTNPTNNNSIYAGGSFVVHEGSETGPVVATVPANGASSSATYVPYTGTTGSPVSLYFVYQPPAYSVGLTPEQQEQVRNADAVVVYVGTRNNESAEEMDRYSLDLPRYQDQLAKLAAELNPRTVVWIQAVGQMNIESFRLPWTYDDGNGVQTYKVPSIVWSNYNGQQQGEAFARILFGQANPSGKLTFTWYADQSQLAHINDYRLAPTADTYGRTYEYFTGDVAYPFGYGLSYSTFQYSNDRIVGHAGVAGDDTITFAVDVTNTSSVAGQEVVELYVTAPGADGVNRPLRQLKGFDKVAIGAGETRTVEIPVKVADLWFWDDQTHAKTWDRGAWTYSIGTSSEPGLTGHFAVTGPPTVGLNVVRVIPDGVALNTAAPMDTIHANLSATRTDDSFFDLSTVDVTYTSSDPAVATVTSTGTVSPVGTGVATITATVTADGQSKSDTFPVVVYAGAYVADEATRFADMVAFGDTAVSLSQADDGIQLSAAVVPAAEATYEFKLALSEPNTAGATVTPDGMFTATSAGYARVTVVADIAGTKVSRTATVTVTDPTLASVSTGVVEVVRAGGSLPVTVAGFPAGSTVDLALGSKKSKADAPMFLDQVLIEPDGTGSAVVTVPEATAPGAYLIIASQGEDRTETPVTVSSAHSRPPGS